MNNDIDLGGIRLITTNITNNQKTNTLDFRGSLISLDIYEDINHPVVRADIVLADSVNLISKLPILGGEEIEVSFVSEFRDKLTTYKFFVYTIDAISKFTNNDGAAYVLRCVSNEYKQNSKMIDKAYDGSVGGVVGEILTKEIQTKKYLNIENTKGLQQIVIPKLPPFAAIDFLKQRAVGNKASGGVFAFYENQNGFNFTTLESLIEAGQSNIETFYFTHTPVVAGLNMKPYRYRNLINVEYISKFDTASSINSGALRSRVKSFDIATKQITDNDYDISDASKYFTFTEKKMNTGISGDVYNSTKTVDPLTFFSVKDTFKPNDYRPEYLAYKNAFLNLFNQNVMRCYAYGDNFLYVGRTVNLTLPNLTGLADRENNDNISSGNYIVTKLRHSIITNGARPKYYMSFDCNRVGIKS